MPLSNYSGRRIRGLVEGYQTYRALKDTKPGRPLSLLIEMADLDIAVGQLTPVEYHAILLCGLLGLTQIDAAEALGVRQSTISRRYDRGLEILKNLLNGADE